MSNKIKNLKIFLEDISDKDMNVLSSDKDIDKFTKIQAKLVLDVATFLYGKATFTEKQLVPYLSQADVWFVLEKLRREGLINVDDKGVPHRTQLGTQVNKYMEKNNPSKKWMNL